LRLTKITQKGKKETKSEELGISEKYVMSLILSKIESSKLC